LARRRFPWAAALACAVLVLAGLAAYSNSFNGPFIFDDTVTVDKPTAKRLWPIRPILAGPRPVGQLTLALNYTLGGADVKGYHVVNVAVHLLAGLMLFGVMRRTLMTPRLAGRFTEESATALGFCTALLWTLHPLQTEAVTYVIQRMESLMGLFYLLTLYCLIKSASSPRPAGWTTAAVISCALGMGCKEVMVSAPAMLLLYDRIFITGSFRETLRRRWGLYLGLAATWLVLGHSIAEAVGAHATSAGFSLASVTPREYARSQLGVILHYLALAFRPTGLCLDYDWPVAKNLADILPGAIVVGALMAATVLALVRRPMWGFAGAWFFLILAPTSSFLPIKDLAFEHRMYLPLAAVAAVTVVAIYLVSERLVCRLGESEAERALSAELLALVLAISAAALLGALTWRRNAQYQSGIAIWQDTVNKRRDNPRAWNNLADALINADNYAEVLRCCDEAIRLRPNFPEPYNNRGLWYAQQGQFKEAADNYSLAIQMRENFPMAYNNRASACIHLGQYEKAIEDCLRAIELDPELAMAYYNLGEACSQINDDAEAIAAYSKAIALRWNYAETYYKLARALQRTGRRDEALRNYDKAIAMSPDYTEAYNERGNARLSAGEYTAAIRDFDKALELKHGLPETYRSRALAHYYAKQYDEAWADAQACEKLGGRLEPDFLRALSRDSGRSR
jgi:tetratricopeptide (TPR) repeat protein